ncbi:uncharacterized protein V1518DRAFT_410409 [Limtongia smithiae]|uniref:uncharacterized protein n=1 Tax=Limtongia smithiae TaxID=1125753 RepID=UPI0034CF1FEC
MYGPSGTSQRRTLRKSHSYTATSATMPPAHEEAAPAAPAVAIPEMGTSTSTSTSTSTPTPLFAPPSQPPRFGIPPLLRLPTLVALSTIVAVPLGCYRGGTLASLRFLAENSHRLPTTVQGWYFYHKRKNYVILHAAMKESFKFTLRTTGFIATMFGLEAGLDAARGQIDFVNTMIGAVGVGFLYAASQHIPRSQVKATLRSGAKFGLIYGIAQDGLRAYEGNLWYYNRLRRVWAE